MNLQVLIFYINKWSNSLISHSLCICNGYLRPINHLSGQWKKLFCSIFFIHISEVSPLPPNISLDITLFNIRLDLFAFAQSILFVKSNGSYGVIMIDIYSFLIVELLPENIRNSLNFIINIRPSIGARSLKASNTELILMRRSIDYIFLLMMIGIVDT